MNTGKKFALESTQFGYSLFIGDPDKTVFPATDAIEEARIYVEGEDNPVDKLLYWEAYTGYNLLIKYVE